MVCGRSALITVTLAALSVGYTVGGRWADRRASTALLTGFYLIPNVGVSRLLLLIGLLLLITSGFGLAEKQTRILTDDLNPVDVWSERINRVARGDLHAYFSPNGLSW